VVKARHKEMERLKPNTKTGVKQVRFTLVSSPGKTAPAPANNGAKLGKQETVKSTVLRVKIHQQYVAKTDWDGASTSGSPNGTSNTLLEEKPTQRPKNMHSNIFDIFIDPSCSFAAWVSPNLLRSGANPKLEAGLRPKNLSNSKATPKNMGIAWYSWNPIHIYSPILQGLQLPCSSLGWFLLPSE
jgi:hypothetical protein